MGHPVNIMREEKVFRNVFSQEIQVYVFWTSYVKTITYLYPTDFYNFSCIFRFLQAGSYPVSSPDGGQFPPGMKVLQFPRNLTFHPENGEHSLLINSPEPGNWFLLAYINKKEKTDYVQEVM